MIQQQSIEVILMRQLASYLAMPICLVDPAGNMLFYNEPAETLLGRRFDEVGPMGLQVWSTDFKATYDNGEPMPPEALPLVVALQHRRPEHTTVRITGLDGVSRRLEVTAFPLVGQGGRYLGAVATFWEISAQ